MQYTDEEMTYVGCVFTTIFSGRNVNQDIYESYRNTFFHIQQKRLNLEDLYHIRNALLLAEPMHMGISNEEDHLFTRAMLTTKRMIIDRAG